MCQQFGKEKSKMVSTLAAVGCEAKGVQAMKQSIRKIVVCLYSDENMYGQRYFTVDSGRQAGIDRCPEGRFRVTPLNGYDDPELYETNRDETVLAVRDELGNDVVVFDIERAGNGVLYGSDNCGGRIVRFARINDRS